MDAASLERVAVRLRSVDVTARPLRLDMKEGKIHNIYGEFPGPVSINSNLDKWGRAMSV